MAYKNIEDRRNNDKKYRAANRQKVNEREWIWRIKNKDRLKAADAKRRLAKRAQCLIAGARTRCKNKSVAFGLEDFESELQRRIDAGFCELSGTAFDMTPGRKPNSPSLDRINPAFGYTPDNVRVICHALNAALGDWGEERLQPIMEAWLRRRLNSSKPA